MTARHVLPNPWELRDTARKARVKLGRYVTYHKSGAVSFRLAEFLRSLRGQEQLRRAMGAY